MAVAFGEISHRAWSWMYRCMYCKRRVVIAAYSFGSRRAIIWTNHSVLLLHCHHISSSKQSYSRLIRSSACSLHSHAFHSRAFHSAE